MSLPVTKDPKNAGSGMTSAGGYNKKIMVVGASQKTTKGHSPKLSKSKRDFVRVNQPVKN